MKTIIGDLMNESIWGRSKREYPSINKDIETEILVVGGGICGILCAYQLSSRGYSVVLVEKDSIGSHRTFKSTAVVTALQDVSYSKLGKSLGKRKAKLYLEANLYAVKEFQKLSEKYSFDYKNVSSYKYSSNKKELEDEMDYILSLGYDAYLSNISFNMIDSWAIEFKNQGQINPVKLIDELSVNFKIYEHSMITKIKNNYAYVKKHKIHAKKIIVATGYPFFIWHGGFYMKLSQNKSYVIALKTNNKSDDNGIGINNKDLYFTSYKDYLLIGGNDIELGSCCEGFKKLKEYALKKFPDSKVEKKWVNQDCVSLDGMPYIGRLRFLRDVYVATGFNLWGMTGAMLSSLIIADMICKKENTYSNIFSIYRRMPLIPLIKSISKSIVGLVQIGGPRCTHMGCKLKQIGDEFECSCHGSKYKINGELIENPAMSDLKRKM